MIWNSKFALVPNSLLGQSSNERILLFLLNLGFCSKSLLFFSLHLSLSLVFFGNWNPRSKQDKRRNLYHWISAPPSPNPQGISRCICLFCLFQFKGSAFDRSKPFFWKGKQRDLISKSIFFAHLSRKSEQFFG